MNLGSSLRLTLVEKYKRANVDLTPNLIFFRKPRDVGLKAHV